MGGGGGVCRPMPPTAMVGTHLRAAAKWLEVACPRCPCLHKSYLVAGCPMRVCPVTYRFPATFCDKAIAHEPNNGTG